MKFVKFLMILALALALPMMASAKAPSAPSAPSVDSLVYKTVDGVNLPMKIYYPDREKFEGARPAIVLFYGGGWNVRRLYQFEPFAAALAELGMVGIVADYRVYSVEKTTPFESVKDAKSAMRYVRANAEKFGINPDMIAAGGGSAGGHLAAATALVEKYNEDTDDLSVDCKANLLVLFNAVVDNGPGGYACERINGEYKDFSPLHNILPGAPPTIMFLGDKDHLIPVKMYEYYQLVMRKVESPCELWVYEGGKHGFFSDAKYKDDVLKRLYSFLHQFGYINSQVEK